MDPTMKKVIDMGGRITCEQVAWVEEWVEDGETSLPRTRRDLKWYAPKRSQGMARRDGLHGTQSLATLPS